MSSAGSPVPRRRRMRVGLSLALLVLVLVLTGAGYTAYRVNRFKQQVFRDSETPPQTEYEQPAPAATTTPAATTVPAATTGAAVITASTPTTPPRGTAAPRAVTVAQASPSRLVPTATPLPYGSSAVTQRLARGERINVLLLGLGGAGHDGAYLTDTIQVMSFDPRSGTVTLISVPRDLYVQIPPFKGRGGYWGKINEAYLVGIGASNRDATDVPYAVHADGGRLASQVVAQVLGIPIDYWVSLDFAGFRQFVDALGGVDVNVERAFTDTHYPANDNERVNSGIMTVHFDAGLQPMDGARALIYARSRYSPQDGSDFGRARRQQRLMAALKDKLLRVETIPKVFALLSALEGHLHTSFSFSEVKDLAGWAQAQASRHRQINVTSGVLSTDNLLYATTSAQGAYILLPRGGMGRYAEIHRYVSSLLGGAAPIVSGSSAAGVSPTPGAGAR